MIEPGREQAENPEPGNGNRSEPGGALYARQLAKVTASVRSRNLIDNDINNDTIFLWPRLKT